MISFGNKVTYLKPDDMVVFAKLAGIEIEEDKVIYRLMPEHNILYIEK